MKPPLITSALLLFITAAAEAATPARVRTATAPSISLDQPALTSRALPNQPPRQIAIAAVRRRAQPFAGRMEPAARAQVRMLAAPRLIERASIDKVSVIARFPVVRGLQTGAIVAAARADVPLLAQMRTGVSPGHLPDFGAIRLALITELAVANNPDPATWGKFPEGGGLKLQTAVYNGQATEVTFLVRTTLRGNATPDTVPRHYILQYVVLGTAVPANNAPGPWQSPAGLVLSVPAKAKVQATPATPLHAAPIAGYAPKRSAFGYFVATLPPPFFNARMSPGSFYVRVVPVADPAPRPAVAPDQAGARRTQAGSRPLPDAELADQLRQPVPAPVAHRPSSAVSRGAPSNWVRIDVPGSLVSLQFAAAQKQAEQAKINQEIAEQKAAQEEKRKAEQATKDKAAALWIERLGAQIRIKDGYEVEVLSYVPPKFQDDSEAAENYLTLATDINWSAGGKAFVWGRGESYQVGWALNLLQSNVGPVQQLWLLTQGIINGLSEGYETAKNTVVGVVADAISGSGIYQCLQACRATLKKALELALSYCGIPPSIPSTRELYREGSNYLAANLANAIVEQSIGVELPAGEITDKIKAEAKDLAREKLYQSSKKGIAALVAQLGCPAPNEPNCGMVKNNPYSWGIPDPYFRSRPAMVYLRIKPKPGANLAGTSPYSLELEVSGSFVSPPSLPLRYIPPEGMVVPVVLTPKTYNWTVVGHLTKNTCDCGQPVYMAGHSTTIKIYTIHTVRSETGNADFSTLENWATLDFDGAFVQDFQDGDIFNGYKGELKQQWVVLP
ncbi:MAG: hypothetical protein DMF56_24295 [Acidobacteria bacterium]|nr:MAG: hypothetical protein DMF56_24295 [Acidobacteriota bacterium]